MLRDRYKKRGTCSKPFDCIDQYWENWEDWESGLNPNPWVQALRDACLQGSAGPQGLHIVFSENPDGKFKHFKFPTAAPRSNISVGEILEGVDYNPPPPNVVDLEDYRTSQKA